jgi:HEAT repeat protein
MGNAAARCKSDLSTAKETNITFENMRAGAKPIAWLFFFVIALAVNALSQDLSAYAEKLRSGNTEEKREALFEIRNLRSEEASQIALAALQDHTPIVRATAASSVIYLPPQQASAALLPLLKDKDPFVRREAAYALGEVGEASTGAQLISTLTGDKDPEVRTAAAIALGKVGDPAAVDVLVGQFKVRPTENNEMLRSAAAKSIGQIAEKMRSGKITILTPQNFLPEKYKDLGTKPSPDLVAHFSNAVRTLGRILENSSEADETRREAAFALGAIGDRSAETTLSKYTSSSDPYLAEICREALLKLKASE